MKNQDWEIPANLQPDPDDYSFDLERALKAVVNLKTYVPPTPSPRARSAPSGRAAAS